MQVPPKQVRNPFRPMGPVNKHYWLLASMAKQVGLDVAGAAQDGRLAQTEWADMVRSCRGCLWVDGCQRFLDAQKDGSKPVPDLCENGRRLQDMLQSAQSD